MADKKITDLVDGGDPQATDDFVVARAGDNFKVAWSSMAAAATEGNIAATLSGNTAGALAGISSGTITLAGGNNITLSQAGNAVTISGANIGGAQTGISGLMNSETTYTSGTVELVQTGAITIASNAGQQFVFSVDPQSVQPETQTFIGGISASDTLYTSGSVRLTGSQAATVRSGTGQLVVIDVPAQTTQTQGVLSVGLSTGGNTSGDTTVNTGSRMVFVGSNNITLSQGTAAGATTITISGPSVAGAQTGISGIANSETTYTSGTVSLSELGALTIRSSTGQIFQLEAPATSLLSATGAVSISINGSTISIGAPTQTVQTQNLIAATLDGNTDGALALVSSGTLTLAGGNNITLSQAGNAVTISGANVGGAQTGISGIANSETTYTSGTVSLSELGAITIRSTTGNQFQLSVNAQSVQPETQTFIAGISASDTLYTSGNVRLTGVGGGVTVSSNTGQRVDISVAAQSVQPETQTFIAGVSASDTLYTSGNVRITGVGGGITVSSNTGQRIDLSVAAQSVQPETQTFIGGVSASNTLYTSGSVRFTGSQAVTVRSGTGQLVVIDAPAQSVQPETQTFIAGVSASDTLYTSGNVRITGVGGGVTVSSNTGQRVDISVAAPVAQTNQAGSLYAISNTSGTSSGTYDARTLSIAGAGMITVAASNSGWRISASQSVQTQQNVQALYDGANSISSGTVSLANANGVTFSNNAQTLSASVNQSLSMFAVSNTTQSTSGTAHKSALSFAGAGVASVGVTGGSVVVSVPAGGGAGFSGGVSTGGNTAGATGITGTQNVFVGVTPMSLSQTTGANGGTVSILAPATSSLSATGAVEISTNGSTISIGAPNIKSLGDYQNFPMAQATLMTHAASISKTPFYFPIMLAGKMTANSFVIRLSAVTTNTVQSFSVHAGFYTLVNSTSMALLGSWSESYVQSTASSASWSGIRNYVMTGVGTHTALSNLNGGDYVIGLMFSAGAAGSMAQSIMGAGTGGGPLGRIIPGVNQQSTGTSQGAMPLNGRGSTTVNALPANVVASELINQGQGASMQLHPWVYIRS